MQTTLNPRAHKFTNSTALDSAWYNVDTKSLWILWDFADCIYRYDNVPEEVYNGLLSAESAGKFATEYIKAYYGPAVIDDDVTLPKPVVNTEMTKDVYTGAPTFNDNAFVVTFYLDRDLSPADAMRVRVEILDVLDDFGFAYSFS